MSPKLDTQTVIDIFNNRKLCFELVREQWFKETNLSNPAREIIVYIPMEIRRIITYIQEQLPEHYKIEVDKFNVASDLMWNLMEAKVETYKIKECALGSSHVVSTYQLDMYTAIIEYVHLIVHGVLHVDAESYDIYKPTITIGEDSNEHIFTDPKGSIRDTIYIPVGIDKKYAAMFLDETDAAYEQWPMDKMLFDLINAIKDGPEQLCPMHDYNLWHNESKRKEADGEIRDLTFWLFTNYHIDRDALCEASFIREKLTIEPNEK